MDNTFPNDPQTPPNPQIPQQPQQPNYSQFPPTPQYQAPYSPPPAPSRGRRLPQLKTWQWIAAGVGALVIACCLCGGIISAMNGGGHSLDAASSPATATAKGPTATPQPTPTQTPAPKWTVTHTFSGSGIKQTPTFTAPDDWRILWSCTPSSFYNSSYNVIVTVYNSDGSISDIAVNTICKSGNTHDYTEEHSGGPVYLDINSEGDWKIQVEELR